MKKLLLLASALLAVFAGLFVYGVLTSPKTVNAGVVVPVCEVVDVPAHWEVRHWIPATYRCDVHADFWYGSRDVSQFYIKPTGDDHHCHRIQWNNLTNSQKIDFSLLHFELGAEGAGDYNQHIVENPEATEVTAGYFTGWEDGRADSVGDEEYEVPATYIPGPDADSDGICDSQDNCINIANTNQEDFDRDGIGDACEDEIDCVWSSWGRCSAECGGGLQTRTHLVEAQYGGASCEGPSEESCNTDSCSTRRWCFPDRESLTGFLAQAIPSNQTPEVGKPWDPGKMLDRYCSYTPIGTCPTECGYEGGSIPDGQGGEMKCDATEICVSPTPNPDVCPNLEGIQYEVPKDYHIAADNVSCVQFGQAGPEPQGPSNPSNPTVLGATTGGTGTVLGATTMAKTGVAEENIMNLMFAFGMLLTTFGIRKFSSSKVK